MGLLRRRMSSTHRLIAQAQTITHNVSVIIPVWNMAGYLPDAIASIPPVHEILIVDAEIDDNTLKVARELAAQRPEIRLSANPNKWPASGRNVGLQAARGDIIAFHPGPLLDWTNRPRTYFFSGGAASRSR